MKKLVHADDYIIDKLIKKVISPVELLEDDIAFQ